MIKVFHSLLSRFFIHEKLWQSFRFMHFPFCLLSAHKLRNPLQTQPIPTLSKERSAVKEKLKCLCTDETETRFVFGLAGNCEIIIRKVLHIKSAIKRRTDLRHYVCLWRRHEGLTCLISQFSTHGCELKHVLIRVNCMWIGSTSDDFNCETWRRVDAASALLELRLMSTPDLKVSNLGNLCCENKKPNELWGKKSRKFSAHKSQWFWNFQHKLMQFLAASNVGLSSEIEKNRSERINRKVNVWRYKSCRLFMHRLAFEVKGKFWRNFCLPGSCCLFEFEIEIFQVWGIPYSYSSVRSSLGEKPVTNWNFCKN